MSVGERPLHQPRLAELVAGILRDRIVGGQLSDGTGLPRQEDLLAEFGVSPPSLREALRILQSEGLISVRRGQRGGSVVHVPDAGHVARSAASVLRARDVSDGDIAGALGHITARCAALSAARADRGRTVVPRLRAAHRACQDEDDPTAYEPRSRAFRHELVSSCGNLTLALLADALEEVRAAQEQDGRAGPREADLAAQAVPGGFGRHGAQG